MIPHLLPESPCIYWDMLWSSITHGTWDSNTTPANFTSTFLYPHYLILGRQGRAAVALVSLRSDWLTLLAFGLAVRLTQLPRAKVRSVLMQQLWGRKLPNFSFYRREQRFRGLPESHSEQQLRQSRARLIPTVVKSEGISGYLNEGNRAHLFKTSVWVNVHYFYSSFLKVINANRHVI